MTPAFTTANLASYWLQVAAIVFIGAAAVRLAGLPSPRARLLFYRALLVACLVLPFIAVGQVRQAEGQQRPAASASQAQLAMPPGASVLTIDAASADADTSPAASWPVGPVVGGVLLLGITTRLAWLLFGLVGLRRLRNQAHALRPATKHSAPAFASLRAKSGDRAASAGQAQEKTLGAVSAIEEAELLVGASADFLVSDAVEHPVTFGVVRPAVLVPDTYAALERTEQTAIACHELLHVRRHDWLQTVSEELLRALFWFQPAIWWLAGQLDLGREQLVDQHVIAVTERRQPYLNALVRLSGVPLSPALRPASLLLGRAHLLERVALLSKEVRMSRSRLAASLVLITAALVFGGRLVVHALPLSPAPEAVVVSTPSTGGGAVAPVATKPAGAQDTQAKKQVGIPPLLNRVEPRFWQTDSKDVLVLAEVTIDTTGAIVGPLSLTEYDMQASRDGTVAGSRVATSRAGDLGHMQEMLNSNTMSAGNDRLRAAFEALTTWRFEPPAEPVETVIGFNFARTDQSGPDAIPVPIGGNIPPPVKLRDVKPVYPQDAYVKGTQGVVIMQILIDGAGIPIEANVLRPVEGLTTAAVKAALQWRFTPSAEYPRRLMTVTVNFVLGNSLPTGTVNVRGVEAGVSGGVQGGVVGGVQGGVVGGVAGGISSNTVGIGSFGPPKDQWPTSAIRVGGSIKAPSRVREVKAVYPQVALDARVQGIVIVEILVGTDGKVEAGRILRSIPSLDQAALDAVKQWEFTPTLLNGTAVPVIMTVTVNFTLGE
jgi:TonB family protein